MGLQEGDIPANIIEYYFNDWTSVYPDNECLTLHNTVASLYEWLIRNAARDATGGGSRKEKVGELELTLSDTNRGVDWSKAYDQYLDNPDAAFPSCRGQLVSNGARIIINGTNRDTVDKINDKTTRFNQFDDRSPYRARTRKSRVVGFKIDEDDYYR